MSNTTLTQIDTLGTNPQPRRRGRSTGSPLQPATAGLPSLPKHPATARGRQRKAPNTPSGSGAIEQTRVHRTLPPDVRAALDTALITRPADCPTPEAAFRKFRLGENYGLKAADIRHYAEALEAFARPLIAGVALSALLKALPPQIANGATRANRVFVWSRFAQVLTDFGAQSLTTAEFARLAQILRPPVRRSGRAAVTTPTKPEEPASQSQDRSQTEDLRSLVCRLYGVNFAEDTLTASPRRREDDPTASSDPSNG